MHSKTSEFVISIKTVTKNDVALETNVCPGDWNLYGWLVTNFIMFR